MNSYFLLQRKKPGPRPKSWDTIDIRSKNRLTAPAVAAIKKVAEEHDATVTSVAANIIYR